MGYFGMFILTLIPILWLKVVNPHKWTGMILLLLKNERAERLPGPFKALPEISEKQNNVMITDGNSAALHSHRCWRPRSSRSLIIIWIDFCIRLIVCKKKPFSKP
jgi:hypothetical protein